MVGNEITIVGNLTKDPELRFTPAGKAVASLSIANNRKWTSNGEEQEQTSYFDVVAWDTLAENVAETLVKGSRAVVVGRLEQRSWENDEGEKRYKIEIIADECSPSLRWASAAISRNESSGSPSKPSKKKVEEYSEEPF